MFNQLRTILAQQFQAGSFLRNLTILGSGTALAQIVPILASPILTRIYSPEDFAMFAVFNAFVSTLTPIVCGKYEVALVLPKNNVAAEHLFGIALYVAFGIAILLTGVFLFTGHGVLSVLNAEKLGYWIFAVPAALLLTGFFTAASYFANRQQRYHLMSKARVARSLLTALISILAGLVGNGFGGLLTGFFSGLIMASVILFFADRRLLTHRTLQWGKTKKLLAWKYRHYPMYNASTGLLDGLTLSLPVFFLSRYFPESIVGYYALVIRVSSAPVGFISASVSQINLKKVVDLVNSGKSPLPYLIKLSGILAIIILIPAVIIVAWGPELFTLVFGTEWTEAGSYARILMPAIAVQFIASTLSSTLGATNNNRIGAMWKLLSFVSTLAVFFWFAPRADILTLLYAVTVNNILLYLLYMAAIFYAGHKPRNFK